MYIDFLTIDDIDIINDKIKKINLFKQSAFKTFDLHIYIKNWRKYDNFIFINYKNSFIYIFVLN